MDVIFVAHYSEVLKTFFYYAKFLQKKGFVVSILVNYRDSKELNNLRKIFIKQNVPQIYIKNLELNNHYLWNKSSFYKIALSFIYPVFLHLKARNIAINIINRFNPDVIVVGSEYKLLNRELIYQGNKRSIYTVLLQWTLSPSSIISAVENKQRKFYNERSDFRLKEAIFRYLLRLVTLPNVLFNKVFNLEEATRRTTKFAGGGNCVKFFTVSKKTYDFYVSTGVKRSKIEIIGHPIFEEQLYLYDKNNFNEKNSILSNLKIPTNGRLIVWANNETKEDYKKYYARKYILKSLKEKLYALLDISDDIYIVFKIHPYWDTLDEYSELKTISKRLKVLQNYDLQTLTRCSQLFITRFSGSAVYAIINNVPTLTYNFPKLPASDLYDEIGGSFHVKDIKTFRMLADAVLSEDRKIILDFQKRRKIFLNNVLGMDTLSIQSNDYPSCMKLYKKLQNLI